MNRSQVFLNINSVVESVEMTAYEYLWTQKNASFKTIADLFRKNPNSIPSELVNPEIIQDFYPKIQERLKALDKSSFGIRINHTIDYPNQLRDATHPIELLYFKGDWGLVYSKKIVSIVGSRKPSENGIRRTKKLVKMLVEDGYTIMSGLAEGIDTIAHTTAIEMGGETIAVIGTPIDQYYPKQNKYLQDEIAQNYLLVSQIPFEKYSQQSYKFNRFFFPERNATMSALSQATIIIEAGETSGTLTQARAALSQGRKLFILDNNFKNPNITWAERFDKKGAVRLKTYEDFARNMEWISDL